MSGDWRTEVWLVQLAESKVDSGESRFYPVRVEGGWWGEAELVAGGEEEIEMEKWIA